jgi:hypothetical protein
VALHQKKQLPEKARLANNLSEMEDVLVGRVRGEAVQDISERVEWESLKHLIVVLDRSDDRDEEPEGDLGLRLCDFVENVGEFGPVIDPVESAGVANELEEGLENKLAEFPGRLRMEEEQPFQKERREMRSKKRRITTLGNEVPKLVGARRVLAVYVGVEDIEDVPPARGRTVALHEAFEEGREPTDEDAGVEGGPEVKENAREQLVE